MKKIDYDEGDEIGGVYTHTASFTSGFNTAVDFYNKAFEMGYLPYKSYDNSIKWVNSDGDNLIGDQMFDAVRKEMGI